MLQALGGQLSTDHQKSYSRRVQRSSRCCLNRFSLVRQQDAGGSVEGLHCAISIPKLFEIRAMSTTKRVGE